MRGLDRLHNIGRVAARADCQRDITALSQRDQRLGKNIFIARIVGVRGECGHAVVQAKDFESRQVGLDCAFAEIACQVGRGRRAPAITENKNPASVRSCAFQRCNHLPDRGERDLVQ